MGFPVEFCLASGSPRRSELLRAAGFAFDVRPANIDETQFQGEAPASYVRRLARGKALAAAGQARPGQWVLAADTAVVDGALIMGKPVDAPDAASMLRRLRGRGHQVFSAIAISAPGATEPAVELCVARVNMRAYHEDEIQAYVATGDPLDKAGAYAIQHRGFHPVELMDDCFAGVMGLPLCHLARLVKELGGEIPPDVPQRCQLVLDYTCPVYQKILNGARTFTHAHEETLGEK